MSKKHLERKCDVQIKAYAKINLYLNVTGRRSDGYHDIVSIMQTVDLYDTVTVSIDRQAPGEILLSCDAGLPCDERNLAYRAAKAYFGGEVPYRIEINVKKRIPQEAGLAGGSADCAAVLRALNAELGVYDQQGLIDLGASLGADVPFCLVGGTKITRGIGEKMQDCPPMPDCYTVIARGGQGVSTPAAYKALDGLYGDFSAQKKQSEQGLADILDAMQRGDLGATCASMYNVFESVVLPVHEVASALRQDMQSSGATGVLLSGSGPSIVGFFDREKEASEAQIAISDKGIAAFVAKPVNQ
ncbi:MAG: 4-(cytidine 5'-diphospho)-2-C-methyl-D-erythritol kinase [Clostridia bacterium]|nr:4-(cytidine 5'-diphospho)-2-C-methyl-D-erythritol kinase [Clostridia bacterium]